MTHLQRTAIARKLKQAFPVPAAAPVSQATLNSLATFARLAPYFKSTKPADGRTGRIIVDLEAGGLSAFQ